MVGFFLEKLEETPWIKGEKVISISTSCSELSLLVICGKGLNALYTIKKAHLSFVKSVYIYYIYL